MLINMDFQFLNLKEGTSSKGNWYLLQLLDNDEKHFNFFIKKPDFDIKKDSIINCDLSIYYNLKDKKYDVKLLRWEVV